MMMKRVKIASNFVYQHYLGKLGEKFKTLIKPARRGYWGWRSGKTFSAQGPAQPPGEFTNLFHQSRFRQTSVSACVPASGQGGQPCWTPQELPAQVTPRGTGGAGSKKEKPHQGTSSGTGEVSQAPACQAQRLLNWSPKEKHREKGSAAWKCLSWLKLLLLCNF